MPGTVARYIVRNIADPARVQLVLLWRYKTMPSEREREAALEALRADLADLLDWESASYLEGQVLLNT